MSNRFTAGFAAFNFLFWLPLMMIGGTALGERYADEFRSASGAAQMAIAYVWMLVTMAPMLIKTFFGTSEVRP